MSGGSLVKVYKNVIFWGLLFIIAVLPFIFTTRTFELVLIKTIFFRLLISFLFFVWILKLVDSESIKIPRNPVFIPFLIFLLCVFLSASFSLYKYTGFQAFFSYLSYFIFFMLIIENVEERFQVRLITQTILIVAVIICSFSLLKSISYLRLSFWQFPVYFQFFGNPNFFASYLLAVIPLSFSLFVYSHFKLEKILLFIFSVLCSVAALLTYSQGAWIVIYFYFLIFYIGVLVRYWYKMELLKGFVFAVFPFLAAFILYILVIFSQGAAEKYLFPGNISLAIRRDIWISTWQMIKTFPFVGWGAGTFHIYFPLYRTTESLWMVVSPLVYHAHNEFLEIGQEIGLLGLGVFIWLVFAYLVYGFKLWIKAPVNWKKYPLSFFLGGLGILMHNLVSPSLRWTGIAVFFWLMVALIISVKGIISVEQGEPSFIIFKNRLFPVFKPLRKGLFCGLAIVLFFTLSLQIVKPYQAEVALKKGIEALDDGNLPQAINKFEEAKKINPHYFSAYYKLAYTYRMIGEYEEALKNYRALEKIAPNYARLHYNLGCLYKDLGRYREAIGEFKTALKREDEFIPHFRLMEIYQELDEKELAKKEQETIRTLQRRGF